MKLTVRILGLSSRLADIGLARLVAQAVRDAPAADTAAPVPPPTPPRGRP